MAVIPNAAAHRPSRGRGSFWLRVSFLLAVLIVVAAYAANETRSRRARGDWSRPLRIALVIVQEDAVDVSALELLRKAVPALESHLKNEFRRYRPADFTPFKFVTYGPIPARDPPPGPVGPGFMGAARHTYVLRRYTSDLDDRARVLRGFDSRIYILVRRPGATKLRFAEGESEQDGRIGIARAELDASTVGLTLFVAAHELFHTLGATDKYDGNGHAMFPAGIAQPERVPIFPQEFAEVMAGCRPVSADDQRTPGSIDELFVGTTTAAEIGWSPAAESVDR